MRAKLSRLLLCSAFLLRPIQFVDRSGLEETQQAALYRIVQGWMEDEDVLWVGIEKKEEYQHSNLYLHIGWDGEAEDLNELILRSHVLWRPFILVRNFWVVVNGAHQGNGVKLLADKRQPLAWFYPEPAEMRSLLSGFGENGQAERINGERVLEQGA